MAGNRSVLFYRLMMEKRGGFSCHVKRKFKTMYADRWIREEGCTKARDVFNSVSNTTSVGLASALPSGAKFQNGHLTADAVPVSRVLPVRGNYGRSGSDMATSSDSEDDTYGARYSLETSPQDDRIPSASVHTSGRYGYTRNHEPFLQKKGIADWRFQSGIVEEGFLDRRMQDGKTPHKQVPSAPPLGSSAAMDRVVERPNASKQTYFGNTVLDETGSGIRDPSERVGKDVNASANSVTARLPVFHASLQGPWSAVIAYEACVRLCFRLWDMDRKEEARVFLNNEYTVLRDAFCLHQVLLQPEEELLSKRSSDSVNGAVAPKSKKNISRMKVQVRKVKMGLDPPPGCSFSYLEPAVVKLEPVRQRFSNLNSALFAGWQAARRVRVNPHIPPGASFSKQSLAYTRASIQYMKQFSTQFRNGMITLHNSPLSYDVVPETHACLLRLKSSSEHDIVRMQPGSGEAYVFFPDNHSDDLIIEVQDSKGQHCGRVLAQVASIADDPSDKIRWWPIYREPEHELVGRIQLYINYSTAPDENNNPKCGIVAETVAYDFVLEVAMKAQNFQQRNLLLHGPWKWLVAEFATYYGLSDAYIKLRYLSYIMDVATPTKDCLDLVYDLLLPVLRKGNRKSVLSYQENRILSEVEDQIQETLSLTFENYKSLDESLLSGVADVFVPATGLAAPALEPAVKLYGLLHDVLLPELQLKFCKYFQAAARKRSRWHMTEIDEIINSNEGTLVDTVALRTYYQKMKSLILRIRNEILTDIEIQNQNILLSFIDLPNLCASLYSVDLASRLRIFLLRCPPSGPSPPVTELVIATADFQKDIASWNISPIKGGVDAKELFHSYITLWIQEKRLSLLELCKQDKVKFSGGTTQISTAPFVDDMYEKLKETLDEYEVIISRWPEYIVILENAIADVEKAIIESLERQYSEVLSPLGPKIFGLKYIQKLGKRSGEIYVVPDELGVLLNSMKRMLDSSLPKIETQLKSWASCIPDDSNTVAGESLSEITVMLRTKFRSYVRAVVEKLLENTNIQNATKLKKIIQDSKDNMAEADVRNKMQPLKDLLIKTIDHVKGVAGPYVFIALCRGLWDRLGEEVLRALQNRKENGSWYKGCRVAVSILDDTFASRMQHLLGNSLPNKDLEPPTSILELHSVLRKDSVNNQDNNYYC
ncbi:hypothetical protein Tsubulata_041098 [Turnera subulata]|uniref:Pesticidal crystal cry8Ba protein n=1 Tax=Turnera subulata TaxID=218843 RepID=A0A9Q0FCJ2_9ROSI|nr:hypothetical protein Tsubulata_041098 [Turnera subulata]